MTRSISNALTRRAPVRAPEADAIVSTVVHALIRVAPIETGHAVARAAEAAFDRAQSETLRPEDFEDETLTALGDDPLRARELLRTVLALLAERLDEGPRRSLAQRLPEEHSGLMEEPGLVHGEPPADPGSTAETEREPTGLDRHRAHSNSIINRSNPREDRKLSSGRDTPKVRAEPISEGRPEGQRPIAEAEPGGGVDE